MFGKRKNTSESILILGLGGIGFYLVKRLLHEGYSVTIIESNQELIGYANKRENAAGVSPYTVLVVCLLTLVHSS